MKPTLFYINSFDVTQGTTVKFSWLGKQPVSNTLVIKNNVTNENIIKNKVFFIINKFNY